MLRPVGFVVALLLLVAGWWAIGPWILAVFLVALLVPATRRRMRPNRWLLGGLAVVVVAATAVVVLLPDGRLPIPPGGGRLVTSSYDGHAVQPQPIELSVPQHPGLAANGSSSMHNDAWATDAYQGPGPLGKDPEVDDVVVRPRGVRDARLRPGRAARRALRRPAPARCCTSSTPRPCARSRPWTCPTARTSRQAAVGGPLRRRLLLPRRARTARSSRPPTAACSSTVRHRRAGERGRASVDLTDVVPRRRLPGRADARLGGPHLVRHPGRPRRRVDPATGASTSLDLGEEIANSIAVDDTGVYLVTDRGALQAGGRRHRAAGGPLAGDVRPRQRTEARPAQRGQRHDADRAARAGWWRSPTTPTRGCTSQFYDDRDGRLVCEARGLRSGESATDNSLVAVGDASVVVENNYGYDGPWSTLLGRATARRPRPGRRSPGDGECEVGWTSDEIAPTSVAEGRRWPPAWSTPTRRGRAGGA